MQHLIRSSLLSIGLLAGLVCFGKAQAYDSSASARGVWEPTSRIVIGYPYSELVLISPEIDKVPIRIDFNVFLRVAEITGSRGTTKARVKLESSEYNEFRLRIIDTDPNGYKDIILSGSAHFDYTYTYKKQPPSVKFETFIYSGEQTSIRYGDTRVESILIGGSEALDLFLYRNSEKLKSLADQYFEILEEEVRKKEAKAAERANQEAMLKLGEDARTRRSVVTTREANSGKIDPKLTVKKAGKK